tara:strand:- start:378 stop:581 length:204 start_codon:yes stop_codon:yes gene_type:complete
MRKINILIIAIALSLPVKISYAEAKPDCSQYSSKTLVGIYDKQRCKKGKPPREKITKKIKNIFKKKN